MFTFYRKQEIKKLNIETCFGRNKSFPRWINYDTCSRDKSPGLSASLQAVNMGYLIVTQTRCLKRKNEVYKRAY